VKTGQLVFAYHGCDVTLRDDLVSGRVKALNPSANKYDWLGGGAYFFENDYQRALMFANAAKANPMKRFTKQPIATPSVVGAVLQFDYILDMTTQDGIQEYRLAYNAMIDYLAKKGEPEPKNSKADDDDEDVIVRRLDSDVFNFMHQIRSDTDLPKFQAVRSAFPQGQEVAPSSAFKMSSHIQIALREKDCVRAWFLLPGAELMTEAQYAKARADLVAAKAAYAVQKPRVRVRNA
jgi:hypothetical protein